MKFIAVNRRSQAWWTVDSNDIGIGPTYVWNSDPQLLAACGSESEALLRAAAMGKKPWLTVRDDAVSQVWRLEDIG